MAKFVKGQEVTVTAGNTIETLTNILGKETNSSVQFAVNTLDVSNKSTVNPEYDYSEYDYTDLSISVEGNLNSVTELKNLLSIMKNGSVAPCVNVAAFVGTTSRDMTAGTVNILAGTDAAVPTSLEIDMPASGLATVSLNIECGSDFMLIRGAI